MSPDALTAQALLNCLVREVSRPDEQTWAGDGRLIVRLPRTGRVLRLAASPRPAGPGPRLTGEAELRAAGGWRPAGWAALSRLIADELTQATGIVNDEFAVQVRSSHAALTAITAARAAAGGRPGWAAGVPDPRIARYLASEQSLVAGHRFHPAPKARGGAPAGWLPFAPEAGASFPLHFLAVRAEALDTDGDASALDRLGAPAAPDGYRLLPAHPWQLRLLGEHRWLRRALRSGLLLDLGPGSREVVPTSSVRTVYDPVADAFLKFSLNVRITNCVRKNAWYELGGAVALTTLLEPVAADLAARFPGTAVLAEPGYRTVALPETDAVEGLAVLVRDGLTGHLRPGVTPLLAGALTEPAPNLLDGRDPDWLAAWWEAYVRRVALPVLHALLAHGIVFEPHLQNVLIGVDADDLPAQALLRDLEGVKLVSARHTATLAALKPEVASALAYDAERGWRRVAYCLFVNHLAEVAAAVTSRHPGSAAAFDAVLWDRARAVLAGYAREHGAGAVTGAPLRALLAGAPLPAKANLRLRWARAADREAEYLTVPSPLAPRS